MNPAQFLNKGWLLLAVLLSSSPLSSQQASIQCGDGGSRIATTQTQALGAPGGIAAVLKVSSADDHDKNTHLCKADYVLLITPARTRLARPVDILSTDADWDRTLYLRLDGFAHNGKRVFGVLTERGKYPSITLFVYNTVTGKVELINLRKQFAHVIAERCWASLSVVGTIGAHTIVIEVSSATACAAHGRWQVTPNGASAHRVPRGTSVQNLFTEGSG